MQKVAVLLLALAVVSGFAGQPRAKVLTVKVDPIEIPQGASNAVVTVYKAVWLGTVLSPWKPTAIFPASRTNTSITVLPGIYHFRATTTSQQYGQSWESDPSNVCTNTVAP